MQLLKDKIVFLTGGSMGIGLECAKRYAKAGANIYIMANDASSLTEAENMLGEAHCCFFGDVSVEQDVQQAIQQCLDRFARIDVIHNNAGISSPSKPLHETSEDEWQKLFNVNLKGIFYTTKFGLDTLKKTKGCILNTSSLVGEIGQENHAAYTATKGAINALTKSMALDYAKFNIRVNAVLPAGVWTPLLKEWSNEQPDTDNIKKYLDNIHPLGYCPEADVIADACLFLVSDMARFITGNMLPVSGGAELGYRNKILNSDITLL